MDPHLTPALQLPWLDVSITVLYLLGMLVLGYYVSRRISSFDDYMIAGRTMTTPILICSLISTYYGLDVLFGTSELGFNAGAVAFFGYSQLSLLIYVYAAFALTKRLRGAEFKSLPEIMERHYGRGAGLMGAVASFVYSIPALSLFGLGRVTEVVLGLDARIGALIVGGIALVYTLLGGLWAVAITDTIQFVLMCVTLAIAIPIVMAKVGGFDQVAEIAPAGYFEPFGDIPIWLVIAYAATGISILVDPGFYQRIFAARDFRQARTALLVGLLVWAAYDWLVTAGGMLARGAIVEGLLPSGVHPNDALLSLVTLVLPVGLAGIFLAGVVAAAMSTLDSYSLVAGGNIVYDVYRPLFNRNASDRELVRYTKLGIFAAWVFAYALAFVFERLMALWVFTSSLLISTVLVPILMALYRKRPDAPLAGVLSAVSGLASVIAYYLMLTKLGTYDRTYGTYIWSFEVAGTSVSLWQEYAAFFTVPISMLGFAVGNSLGRRSGESSPPETAS